MRRLVSPTIAEGMDRGCVCRMLGCWPVSSRPRCDQQVLVTLPATVQGRVPRAARASSSRIDGHHRSRRRHLPAVGRWAASADCGPRDSLGTTAVFALGDTQYPHGSLSDFQNFYDASGARSRTRRTRSRQPRVRDVGSLRILPVFRHWVRRPDRSARLLQPQPGGPAHRLPEHELHADRLYGGEDLA